MRFANTLVILFDPLVLRSEDMWLTWQSCRQHGKGTEQPGILDGATGARSDAAPSWGDAPKGHLSSSLAMQPRY